MPEFSLSGKTFQLEKIPNSFESIIYQTDKGFISISQLEKAIADGTNETNSEGKTVRIPFARVRENPNGSFKYTQLSATDNAFKQIILSTHSANFAVRDALNKLPPNTGTTQEDQSLTTGGEDEKVNEASSGGYGGGSGSGKFFFSYYPLAEVEGYDYLQVVCKEYQPDTNLSDFIRYDGDRNDKNRRKDKKKGYTITKSELDRALAPTTMRDRYSYSNSKTLGIVQLPMTGGLSEANRTDWGDANINALQIAGAKIAGKAIDNLADADIMGAVGDLVAQGRQSIAALAASGDSTTTFLKNYFAGQAVGVGNLAQRAGGLAINNNLELLFRGPNLRSFSYSYNFTPRGEAEAQAVKKIIWFFKKNMAPRVSEQKIFLQSPNVFHLQYKYKEDGIDVPHPFLNRIKMCALTSCNVNYTPSSQYMTYGDGSPTAYNMTLEFKELDPIYQDDYGDNPGGINPDAWELEL